MYEHACCEGLSQSRLGVALRPWVSFAATVRVFQVCCKQKGVCFAVVHHFFVVNDCFCQRLRSTIAIASVNDYDYDCCCQRLLSTIAVSGQEKGDSVQQEV